MVEREYELLLKQANGKNKVVTWTGITAESAARRYMDCKGKPGESIIATRPITTGVFVWGGTPIID